MKYYVEVISNIDSKNMNSRVKLSGLRGVNENQDSWVDFRSSFEALSKAVGIEEMINEILDNEELYKYRLKYD